MPDTLRAEAAFIYGVSVPGMVRTNNEDSILTKQWKDRENPLGLTALLAIADGMGGHENGEWASKTAIECIDQVIGSAKSDQPLDQVLMKAIKYANQTIGAAAQHGGNSPGTTLSIVAIRRNQAWIASVGDSRIYLHRKGELSQLTKDDTLAELLIAKGQMTAEEAAKGQEHHILVKSIGQAAELEPTVKARKLKKGDIFLVCSDGLTNMLSDSQIEELIAKSPSLVSAAESLCSSANDAGGFDNISVVLYSFGRWSPKYRPRTGRGKSGAGIREYRILPIALIFFGLLIGAGLIVPNRYWHRTPPNNNPAPIPSEPLTPLPSPAVNTIYINGPSEIPVDSFGQFSIASSGLEVKKCEWKCDPDSAGTFDPNNSNKDKTKFTLSKSAKAGDRITIIVIVHLMSGEQQQSDPLTIQVVKPKDTAPAPSPRNLPTTPANPPANQSPPSAPPAGKPH